MILLSSADLTADGEYTLTVDGSEREYSTDAVGMGDPGGEASPDNGGEAPPDNGGENSTESDPPAETTETT